MRLTLAAVGRTVTAVALLVSTFSAADAQQATTTGVVRGIVTGTPGMALADASITATSVETGTRQSVRTDDGGRYQIPFLSPGRYTLTAHRLGYQPVTL